MTTVSLPDHATLASLRREARQLQDAVAAGRPEASALLERHDPGPPDADPLSLQRAHRVVARAHGFPDWLALKHYFDLAVDLRFDVGPDPADEPVADRFCRLAALRYDGDDPDRAARARALLAASPGLVDASIWAAAAALDGPAVHRHLNRDATLAVRRGGPQRWTPLYHLAYSRAAPDVPVSDVLTIARSLLDAGADPNEGYLWAGQPTPFTLLTGAFGEGEGGPDRQPRHPHGPALAELLLTAGADPNDAQTLYNRMFRPADDHLELLFAHGLGTGDGGPWRARLGTAADSPPELLRSQLSWAIDHGFGARVGLLIAHGVDLTSPLPDGRSPAAAALLAGEPALAELLTAAGAAPAALDPVDALVAAAMAADRDRVTALQQAQPGVAAEARRRRPGLMVWATARGKPATVRLLAGLGFDPNAPGRGDTPVEQGWETPLHQAASDGDAVLVALLLDLGADPTLPDRRFAATPAAWARHFGHDRIAATIEAH